MTEVTAENLTDQDLREEFERCCECRGIDGADLTITEDEHSHDCDTAVIDDIQTALFSPFAEEAGQALVDGRRLAAELIRASEVAQWEALWTEKT